MNNTYACSYVEVLEILKHIPKEDYEKIPKEKIEFYEKNMDKNYVYIYDSVEPKTLRKTDIILMNLYKNYIAKSEEKEKIEEILRLNEQKEEQEKKKIYSVDNIFDNKKIDIQNDKEKIMPESLLENKESIFKRFINKLKMIFGMI